MRETLTQRLEAIRPECPHGRKIKSLLQRVDMCAGVIRTCLCCENAICHPGEQYPQFCTECAHA